MRQPDVLIIGARTRTQLDENLAPTGVRLTPKMAQRLDALQPEYLNQFINMVQHWLRPREIERS
jgi:aryl-alcohol dehydrogenase-like predicted oxidoreductase